jgi:hypothetical protein
MFWLCLSWKDYWIAFLLPTVAILPFALYMLLTLIVFYLQARIAFGKETLFVWPDWIRGIRIAQFIIGWVFIYIAGLSFSVCEYDGGWLAATALAIYAAFFVTTETVVKQGQIAELLPLIADNNPLPKTVSPRKENNR